MQCSNIGSPIILQNEKWHWLASLVINRIQPALHCVLQNENADAMYKGLPKEPADLHLEMCLHQKNLSSLLKSTKKEGV